MRRMMYAGVLLVGLAVTGCGCDDGSVAVDVRTPDPTPPAASAAPTATAAVLQCEPYPTEKAAELLRDPATGEARVQGVLGKAVAVRSPVASAAGDPTFVIAMDVSGKAVVLAHPVLGRPAVATGVGPYAALTTFTEAATGHAQDEELAESLSGTVVSLAISCLD